MTAEIDFAEELNDEQLAAATAPDGPLLVLAAAGTGKTRTLVYRVAYLVQKGIRADNILLLTFTNRAAREMLERAHGVVGDGVSGVWGGTFHHMSNRILRRHASRIGYQSDYTILDRDDSRTLISHCIKELNLQSREFPKRDALASLFSTVANTCGALDELAERRFADLPVLPEDILAVYKLYRKRKQQLGAMDFDDLLVNCHDLFREHDDLLQRYQHRFRHVLVDEYQDTNTVQAGLVDMLAEAHGNLFVVGDDFQSIYAWRGANYRNIMSFPKRYEGTQMFKLETNYRSVPEILEVANACIAGNPEQFQKTLRATRDTHRKPGVIRLRDGREQALFVADSIGRLLSRGYLPGDIAVLYRAHFHSMEAQMELTRQDIPYIITSGVRFFEQAHIKDVCSLLRVLENPEDEIAFARLLMLLPGVGPKTAIKLWVKLGNRFEAGDPAQRSLLLEGLRGEGRRIWQDIDRILGAYREELDGNAGDVLESFTDVYYERYAIETFDNPNPRLEDIRELITFSGKYETVKEFLSDVALLTNVDTQAERSDTAMRDSVHLSTIHQAKGLEWRAVIILWAVEGMFPSPRAIEDSADGDAEERRLFYVAVTRAKDELFMCVPELRRMRDGGVFYTPPSRFVNEVPGEHVRQEYGGGYY